MSYGDFRVKLHEGTPILTKEEIKRLERLSLLVSRKMGGIGPGEQVSKKLGHGMDFAGYQEYQPGDDLRYLDWNLYARLDRLYLKRHVEESELMVHILIDVSRSMTIGMPPKLTTAKKVAAGLTYIGIHRFHHVGAVLFSSGIKKVIPPQKGDANLIRIFRLLNEIEAEDKTNMNASLLKYAGRKLPPGLIILISDFFSPDGYEEGLRSLLFRGHSIGVLHMNTPEDLLPSISGESMLKDVETGEELWYDGLNDDVKDYRNCLTEYHEGLKGFCLRNGILYYSASSELPADRIIWDLLQGFRRRIQCRF